MNLVRIEQGIIGAMILHPDYFIKNLPNYFDSEVIENPVHKKIYNYLVDKVFNESIKDVDFLDLHNKTGISFSQTGELLEDFWRDIGYLDFSRAVNAWLIEAKVIADAKKIKSELDKGEISLDEYYQTLKAMAMEHEQGAETRETLSDAEICKKYVEQYEDKDTQTFLTELSLDNYYRFRRQEVTVIGALNKIGKSLFALYLAMKFSKAGTVLYVSTEMGETDYAERSMAHKTALNSEKIRDKKLNPEELANLRDGLMANKDNVFFECYTRKLSEIEKRVAVIRPDVLILDHLQDMQNPDEIKDEEEGIATNMRRAKLLSIRQNIAVVIMSQLSRQAEGKNEIYSYMLRGSGVIEQVADGTILIKRDITKQPNSATFRIDRNRHGQSGVEVDVQCSFATANFY